MAALLADPVFLTVAIFLARVADVSLGTLRTILVFRSYRYWAAFIGFFEVLVWVNAAGQVLTNLDRWYLTVAYAAGFSAGNVVGIFLEHKMAIGQELVRIVSADPRVRLAAKLREAGHAVVEVPGRDAERPVEVLLVVERRRRVPRLLTLVDRLDPEALYTVSDVKDDSPQYARAFPARLRRDLQGPLKRK